MYFWMSSEIIEIIIKLLHIYFISEIKIMEFTRT